MDAVGNPLQSPRAMTWFERTRHHWMVRILWWRRRYIPMLVWWNDEVDVKVTLRENPLRATNIGDAMTDLHRGTFYEIQKQFADVGITFDSGMGPEGRDWEWDWSLTGPISVTFKRRAQRPELRQ